MPNSITSSVRLLSFWHCQKHGKGVQVEHRPFSVMISLHENYNQAFPVENDCRCNLRCCWQVGCDVCNSVAMQ